MTSYAEAIAQAWKVYDETVATARKVFYEDTTPKGEA